MGGHEVAESLTRWSGLRTSR